MTPALIDTGPSPRGFHRLEAFLTCPTRYYWKRHDRRQVDARIEAGEVFDPLFTDRVPLVRGTLGHVLLAHHYARAVCVEKGLDPERFYSPTDAAQIVAQRYAAVGAAQLRPAVAGYEIHRRTYVVERFTVIGIEKLLETHFGKYRYTARADLIVRMNDTGRVWIMDHKFVGRIEDKAFTRYALSGQFLGLHHLGARTYGDAFGGVLVNVVGCNDLQCERRAPLPAPWALQRYPAEIERAEDEIAERELAEEVLASEGKERALAWPMALSEVACMTPYGQCDFFGRCRWGK